MTTTMAPPPGRVRTVGRVTSGFALANLIAQIVIVFTGGLVRLTASGLGCSSWPNCEPGSFTPVAHEATSYHPYVEFGNRTLSGVLVVIGAVLAISAWREKGRARAFKWLATMPLIGVLVQAVVGGLSVITRLSPVLVGFHLLISVAIVWVSAWIVQRTRETDGPAQVVVAPAIRALGWVLAAAFAVVAALGVVTTGAGPHSGDDVHGYRFAIDPVMAGRIHAGAVWLFVVLLIALIVALYRTAAPAPARRAAWWLAAATGFQAVIGVAQFATGLPVALVSLHLLGLALTTTALTFALLAQRRRAGTAGAPAVAAQVTA